MSNETINQEVQFQFEEKKSRTIALIMILVGGGFGLQHFYYGNVMRGVLYFLFFWTCVPALLSIFEFIEVSGMSDKKFQEKYGQINNQN